MKNVTVINSMNGLNRYLVHELADPTSSCKYFCLKYCPEIQSVLEKYGYEQLEYSVEGTESQRQFMSDFNQLIADISKDNPHKVWWGSDIASKNQFSSLLPELIEQFQTILRIVRDSEFQHLIIYVPNSTLYVSLQKAFRGSDVILQCMEDRVVNRAAVILLRLRKIASIFRTGLRVLVRSYWSCRLLKSRVCSAGQKSHLVLKTFIYNHSFDAANNYREVFFEKLPDFLKDKRKVLILVHVIGDYPICIEKIKECTDYLIVPIEALLGWMDILAATWELLTRNIHIKEGLSFGGDDVADILRTVIWQRFKGVQFYQFLHYWALKNLVRNVSIDQVISTYENYPWERMSTIAIRETSPRTKIVGYQHTVIPQAYMNMFPGRHERAARLLPDRILTTGEEAVKVLQEYGEYEGMDVQPSCAFRFDYLYRDHQIMDHKPIKKILLPLEGFYHVADMVEYVKDQLANHSVYQVRIRTHPLLPWKLFEKNCGLSIKGIKNFEISEGRSLTGDIQWADVVMCWSSTVALEASKMGRPVIHFNKNFIMNFDPLFMCDRFRWTISPQGKLTDVFDSITGLDREEFVQGQADAVEYVKRYFHPVDEQQMSKFIFQEEKKGENVYAETAQR